MPRNPESKALRSSAAWRRLCADVYATETICCHCQMPVDFNAPPRTRWSKSVDHLIPLDKAPHLGLERTNVALSHYGCNGSKGAGTAPRPPGQRRGNDPTRHPPGMGTPSRAW